MERPRSRISRRFAWLLALALATSMLAPGAAAQTDDEGLQEDPEPSSLVEIHITDRTELDRLVATGVDLTPDLDETAEGYTITAVLTPSQEADLLAQGFSVGDTLQTQEDLDALRAERARALQSKSSSTFQTLAESETGALKVLRADYFHGADGEFLSVEAKSVAGDDDTITVAWDAGPGTAIGDGGTINLFDFVDAGVYLYHRRQFSVDTRPQLIEVSSSDTGESVTLGVVEWLPLDQPGNQGGNSPHLSDFVDRYMDPTEVTERIEQLAAEFPDLAEVIELPYQTNGYRRHAQALLGTVTGNAVVVNSVAWGHEGGNDLSVEFVDPGAADQPLTVSVTGNHIVLSSATDGTGARTTTAAQAVAAINTGAGDLVYAHTYRGNSGSAVIAPEFEELTDGLSAPAHVSREPWTVKALRIGADRDGSRMGVLAYAQEHAREWVTPLVMVETAERLLRNYAGDSETRQLVNNLDIFIVPTVNPDGGHYSFYDFNFQRKTMLNHCDDANSDPARRNQWGVDANRNYGVGSLFDGYTGASTHCRSEVFAGPSELSEPESRNVTWLADTYPNIEFAMNTHSFGNYFMWSPGAYSVPGRVTLPRPDFGDEAFFWAASQQILTAIKEHRDTVVTPARTGPIADVLYSAAGNSGDHLWYDDGIFAWNFEVGDAGFQPTFDDEGHDQALEFSNGLIELFRVAYQYDNDNQRPTSSLVPGQGRYDGPVEMVFEASEPVTIFYTLDGSAPTSSSPTIQSAGVREGAESITILETTTVNWFAVDAAGNIERNYNPDGNANNYNKARVTISG